MNSTSFHPVRGFHTTSTTNLALPSLAEGCSLHLWFSLPPLVFPDTYELANYASQYSFWYDGIRNLELPIAAIDQNIRGSLLLDVNVPHEQGVGVEIKVPLHMRYEKPSEHGGTVKATIPVPKAFTACQRSGQISTQLELPSPVLDQLAGKAITQIPLSVISASSVIIPVGNTSDLLMVEAGTAAVVLLSAMYLLRAFWLTTKSLSLQKVDESKQE